MARPKRPTTETPKERRARLNANSRRWYAKHRKTEQERSRAKHLTDPQQAVVRTRRYRAKDPAATREKQRAQWLWWKYKITVADYDGLAERQGNQCGVCGTQTVGGAHSRYWIVDHCHNTEAVRGLLCDACNRGGGCFKDDPVLLRKAAEWFSCGLPNP